MVSINGVPIRILLVGEAKDACRLRGLLDTEDSDQFHIGHVADLDLAAFILVTVVEALTHAAVLRRPDILADGKTRHFVDDVTRLVVRYLRTF